MLFRSEASRLGTKKSGMICKAMSWSGCVRVELDHDEKTGKDRFVVYQEQHHGNGAGIRETIAEGVIGEPTAKKN